MQSCKAPTCEYSNRWKKCTRPNAYNEALAWCKRNDIDHKKCKQDYNSVEAKKQACNRYEERIKLAGLGARRNPRKKLPTPPVHTHTSMSISYKTPPEAFSASPQPAKKSTSSSHVFLSDVYEIPPRQLTSPAVKTFMQNRAANKIITFIKNNVLQRSETLEKRINYYKSIQYYLRNVQYHNCLVPKQFTDKNGIINNGFEVDTILKLTKKIGTKSAYGVIYQTAARSNILSIATKLMPVNKKNKLEVILNTTVTHLLKNKISKHFLISYKTFKCNQTTNSILAPPIIRKKPYYITLNELAHGDLKTLCESPRFLGNDALMYNILIQCFLATYTFHQIGYSHNDCHWGNFLFQISKNTDGYFHYNINGKNLYLKNCGYNMMIYDFGLAQDKNNFLHIRRVLEDYRRVLQAFRKSRTGGWIDKQGYPSNRVSIYMERLNDHIINTILAYVTEERLLNDVVLPYFLSCPIANIFVNNLPVGATVANRQPYVINKQNLRIPTMNPLSSPL